MSQPMFQNSVATLLFSVLISPQDHHPHTKMHEHKKNTVAAAAAVMMMMMVMIMIIILILFSL